MQTASLALLPTVRALTTLNSLYMRATPAAQLGIAVDQPLPGIIFGLDPRYNDYVLSPSTRGAREGVVWQGAVTLDMIDRHSREALEAILAPLR